MVFGKKSLVFSDVILGIVFLGMIAYLGIVPEQSDFYSILFGGGFAFGLYAWITTRTLTKERLVFFLGVAIIARLILLFTFPNLSDDIYRFVWDGRLLNSGVNPFDFLPSHYMKEGVASIKGIRPALYAELNSPEYFTIYPPVAQVSFYISVWLSPNSIWGSAFWMKLLLFASEMGTLFLLYHLPKGKKNILLYALNPLILIEVMGNLHFEGAMIFFLLLAYFFLLKNRWELSAIAFALSIISKLLPLIFLPFLIRRLGWRKSIQYFMIVGILVLLSFVPLYSPVFIENISQSFDLYFRRFEFNASIYYVARWVGFQLKGYNLIGMIGPVLAMLSTALILLLTLLEKRKSIESLGQSWFWAICIYLLFATTIHPWYTSLPVVLCLFGAYRFPLLWSALIWLTYINYSYGDYSEHLGTVALEYILVFGMLVYELWKNKDLEIAHLKK